MNRLLKMAGILAAGIAAGMLGLFFVYLLPVQHMQEDMRASLQSFMAEGENPFLIKNYKGSSLDNYTDAIMLGSAVYESDMPFWQEAVRVPRAAGIADAPMESLEHYLQGGKNDQETEYSRYWHGYLLLLKPLLLFLNYGQIRIVNGCVEAVLILLILCKFMKRGMKRGMAAYMLALLAMFPVVFPFSLQFSTVFYIGNIALLLVLRNHEKWERESKYIYFYQIVGMCTSYFDFLTYPLFTFGIPMVACLVLNREHNLKDRMKFLIKGGLSWSAGYILMWMGKWAVGSAVTGENLWGNALGTVSERASSSSIGGGIGRILAVLRNGYIYFNEAGIIIAFLLLLWIGICIWKYHKRISAADVRILVLTACIPLAWYLAAANHSYVHYWYTFRALSVSVFALAMIPECVDKKTPEIGRAGNGV